MAYPTDPFEVSTYNMIHVHEAFKRGYESMLKHLERPEDIKNDLSNFLGYCRTWSTSIDAHHEIEEAVLFPFLNQKMDFGHEIESHKIIHEGIAEFDAAIGTATAEPAKFNPGVLKAILVKLKDPLFNHLDEEIEHIKPSKVRSAGFVNADLEYVGQELHKYVQSHPNHTTVMVFVSAHTPPELKEVFPPAPWMLRKIIVPFILAAKTPGYWKYSPYSVS